MREKKDVKKELVRRGRELYEAGLALGRGGNISVRCGARIYIKAAGADMSEALSRDYIGIDFEAAVSGKRYPGASTETPVHLACYKADNSVKAVAHVHSPALVAVSALARVLKSNSYEFDHILGENVPVVPFIRPGSERLAAAVAVKVSGGARSVLLARHGAVCFGKDLKEACVRAKALERACRLYLLLRS